MGRVRRYQHAWALVVSLAVLAAASVAVAPAAIAVSTVPNIYASSTVCPGVGVSFQGSEFSPGVTYTISTSLGTPMPTSQVTADANGRVRFTVQVPVGSHGQVLHIAVTPPDGSGLPPGSYDDTVHGPAVGSPGALAPPTAVGAAVPLQLYCFEPGDSVAISSPQLDFSSPTATVGWNGTVQYPGTVTAIKQTGTATITVTGTASGSVSASFTMRNNVLSAGTSLQTYSYIISPSGAIRIRLGG